MAFQVSIGDGIILAQIAWRLAQAFTKGRNSAPAEFHEIENELYSLSAALTAAESEQNSVRLRTNDGVMGNGQHPVTHDVFERIIQNCKITLMHLEEIVKKYTVVSEVTDPQKPRLGKWSHAILKNWRKIEWTTEKGDLSSLQSQIMVHINSLNLLVNINTSSRTASIERSLDTKLALLEDLHQWYVINLKDAVPKRNTPSNEVAVHSPQQHSWPRSHTVVNTFELSKRKGTGNEIICPRATMRSEWVDSFMDSVLDATSGCMFACGCPDFEVGNLSHETTVQRYGLSHMIFPIRFAGSDSSWVLYKAADTVSNQLVDLHIRKIHPSYRSFLEDTLFNTLSERRGSAILAQGLGNSLCYISPESQEEHILASMSDLKVSQTSVESIVFKSGLTEHVQEWIDDVQILQYRVKDLETALQDIRTDSMRWMEYAEISVSFNPEEAQARDDIVSMVIKLRRNTTTKLTDRAAVHILSVEAVGAYPDGKITAHEGLDVLIQFINKTAAKEFHEKVESMRMELFVKGLQYPRSNENVVLNLRAARVECETLYIDDAEISIMVDSDAKYRLTIVSRNKCTIISQNLVEDFFTSPSARPNYTGPTYVVQIEDTGERKVYYHENGFRYLSLSTEQGETVTLEGFDELR